MFFFFFLLYYCLCQKGKYCLIPTAAKDINCSPDFTLFFYNDSTTFNFLPTSENELFIEITNCNSYRPILGDKSWENLTLYIFSRYSGQAVTLNQSFSCNGLNMRNTTIATSESITVTTGFLHATTCSYASNLFTFDIKDGGYVFLNNSIAYLHSLKFNEIDRNKSIDLTIVSSVSHYSFLEKGLSFITNSNSYSLQYNVRSLKIISDERQLTLSYEYSDELELGVYPSITMKSYSEIVFNEHDSNWKSTPKFPEKVQIISGDSRSIIFIPKNFNLPNFNFTGFNAVNATRGFYCLYPDPQSPEYREYCIRHGMDPQDFSSKCPEISIHFPFISSEPFTKEFSISPIVNIVFIYLFGTSFQYRPSFHPNAFKGKVMFSGSFNEGKNQYVALEESTTFFSYINLHNVTLIPSNYNKVGSLFVSSNSTIYPRGFLSVINTTSKFMSLLKFNTKQYFPLYTDKMTLLIDTQIDGITLSKKGVTFFNGPYEVSFNITSINLTLWQPCTIKMSADIPLTNAYIDGLTIFYNTSIIIDDSCYKTKWDIPKTLSLTSFNNTFLDVTAYSFNPPPFLKGVSSPYLTLHLLGRTPIPTPIATPSQTPRNEVIDFISQPYFYLSAIVLILLIIILVIVIYKVTKRKKGERIVAPDESGILVISLLDENSQL